MHARPDDSRYAPRSTPRPGFASRLQVYNPGLRDAIKDYSQWPTIPQLYIQGEFVGERVEHTLAGQSAWAWFSAMFVFLVSSCVRATVSGCVQLPRHYCQSLCVARSLLSSVCIL
jgi:hypothetical protein